MHWFWRGLLSIIVGGSLTVFLSVNGASGPIFSLYSVVYWLLGGRGVTGDWRHALAFVLTYAVPGLVAAVSLFGLLARRRPPALFAPTLKQVSIASPFLSTLLSALLGGLAMALIIGTMTRVSFRESASQSLQAAAGGLVLGGFCSVPALLLYRRLSRRNHPLVDPETRCRKCGYIFRGLTEPRCPECGERIWGAQSVWTHKNVKDKAMNQQTIHYLQTMLECYPKAIAHINKNVLPEVKDEKTLLGLRELRDWAQVEVYRMKKALEEEGK
jgi:hypothetical protein